AEISSRIRLQLQHSFDQEGKIIAVPLTSPQPLDIYLRRYDDEHAEHQRNEEPAGSLGHDSAVRASACCKPQAGASDHEEQRHAQSMRDLHGTLQRCDDLGVLDVEVPTDEQHPRV